MHVAKPMAVATLLLAGALSFIGGPLGATARAQDPPVETMPPGDVAPGPASEDPAPPATAPAPPDDAQETQALLGGLAADDWVQRQRAEDALVELGESARPLLQDHLKHADDAEVRARLESALKRIGANRLIGPSYVTLRLKDAAPAEAFTELSRQAFTALKPYPDNLWQQGDWPKLTLDVRRKPFWVAAQALTEQAGVSFQPWDGGLRLVRGAGQTSGPSVVAGPFLVVATHVTRAQTIMLGNGPAQPARPAVVRSRSNEFGVHLLILPEPKLAVVRAASGVKLAAVLDDHGNDLAPPRSAGGHTFANGHAGGWNVYARLNYPADNPGKAIARLAGSVTFAIQTASETVEIPDPLNVKDAFRVLAGSRVTFHRMIRRGDNYELTASLAPDGLGARGGGLADGGGGGASTLFQSMQSRLRLLNADGEPLERRGFSSNGNGREMRFTIHFSRGAGGAGPDAPARLVWDVPTDTQDVEVAFEFKDLPMP